MDLARIETRKWRQQYEKSPPPPPASVFDINGNNLLQRIKQTEKKHIKLDIVILTSGQANGLSKKKNQF